jgi:hypothetical protein
MNPSPHVQNILGLRAVDGGGLPALRGVEGGDLGYPEQGGGGVEGIEAKEALPVRVAAAQAVGP